MLILVFLLSVLSIPKVWLKPTITDSEANSLVKEEEELRSKRQATFFDLLHLAIEKYANCAEEKLAPLKALSNYPQHEAFPYPANYFSGTDTMLGASQPKQTKPNVICTKVNLCSIANQKSLAGSAENGNSEIVGKALDARVDISESDQKQVPLSVGNPYGFVNFPAQYNPRYSQRPFYQNFLSELLYTPVKVLGKHLFRTSDQQTIVGSTLPKQSVHMESCPCTKVSSENLKSMEEKKANHCSCLNGDSEEIIGTTGLESDGPSEGSLDDNVTPCESQVFNQNLNRLLMQLDEMAENANNKELKQILEKLKMLHSSLDINSSNNADYTTSTKEPTMVGAIALQKTYNMDNINSKLKTSVTLEPTEATVDTTTLANTLSPSNNNVMFRSRADVKSTFLDLNEDKAINMFVSSLGTGNLSDSIDYIEAITSFPPFELNIPKSQGSKLIKDEMQSGNFAQSNDFINPDFNEIVTKSPTLGLTHLGSQNEKPADSTEYMNEEFSIELTTVSPFSNLNIKNYQDLEHVEDPMTSFVSSEDFYPEISKQTRSKLPTLIYNQKRLLDLDKSLNASNSSEKHSKITISITSNGGFKNIQVEHQLPHEKKWEINEKEKMNIDSYIEPILSEIYSGKSKFKTKAPLNIYLHKIEEKPLKLENLPDDDLNNMNRTETRSTMFKEAIEREGSDSEEEIT